MRSAGKRHANFAKDMKSKMSHTSGSPPDPSDLGPEAFRHFTNVIDVAPTHPKKRRGSLIEDQDALDALPDRSVPKAWIYWAGATAVFLSGTGFTILKSGPISISIICFVLASAFMGIAVVLPFLRTRIKRELEPTLIDINRRIDNTKEKEDDYATFVRHIIILIKEFYG